MDKPRNKIVEHVVTDLMSSIKMCSDIIVLLLQSNIPDSEVEDRFVEAFKEHNISGTQAKSWFALLHGISARRRTVSANLVGVNYSKKKRYKYFMMQYFVELEEELKEQNVIIMAVDIDSAKMLADDFTGQMHNVNKYELTDLSHDEFEELKTTLKIIR